MPELITSPAVAEMIKNQEHNTLARCDDASPKIRCVAFIYLGQYPEALEIAEINSFEYFYCLYKQRKFTFCARKMRRLEKQKQISLKDRPFSVLYAQCMYFRGFFLTAFTIFSQFKEPTFVINACAAAALALCSMSSNVSKHKPFCKEKISKKDEFEMRAFLDSAIVPEIDIIDLDYNKSFQFFDCEDRFLNAAIIFKNNALVQRQVNNVIGNFDEIEKDELSKRQLEIVNYNQKYENEINNLSLLQLPNIHYSHLKNIKSHKFKCAMLNKHNDNLTIASKIYILAMFSSKNIVEKFFPEQKNLEDFAIKKSCYKIQKYCQSSQLDESEREILSIFWNKEIQQDQDKIKDILKNVWNRRCQLKDTRN